MASELLNDENSEKKSFEDKTESEENLSKEDIIEPEEIFEVESQETSPLEEPVMEDTPEDIFSEEENLPEIKEEKKTFLYKILSPETRIGKFMRPFLRWAAVIVGFFALGLLTDYLLFCRPISAELENLQSHYTTLQSELSQSENDLSATQEDLLDTQSDLAGIQEELIYQKNYVSLLRVTTHVIKARFELERKDGPATRAELLDAREALDILLPGLEELDPDMSAVLDNRLDLAMNELNRGPDMAKSELDILYGNLLEVEILLLE
ncbi:MAG: hypothetical protein JEZ06_16095 [Anaerolineaceae bacterium]|nr:hypothetical protein [Anaerolineaceae bacterium]